MARPNSEGAKTALVMEIMEVTNAFRGKRFSITGHLGRPRPEIVAIIERAGGIFEEKPRWGTNFLITNADWTAKTVKPGKSHKFEEAQRNGVKIISEAQFYQMLVENGEVAASGESAANGGNG
jgi:NAD-dependent DNA ligase